MALYMAGIVVALLLLCIIDSQRQFEKQRAFRRRQSCLWIGKGKRWKHCGYDIPGVLGKNPVFHPKPKSTSTSSKKKKTYFSVDCCYGWESYIPMPTCDGTLSLILRFEYRYQGGNIWKAPKGTGFLYNYKSIELDFCDSKQDSQEELPKQASSTPQHHEDFNKNPATHGWWFNGKKWIYYHFEDRDCFIKEDIQTRQKDKSDKDEQSKLEETTEWVELYTPESDSVRTGICETLLPEDLDHKITLLKEKPKRPVCEMCLGKTPPKFITARICICQRCIKLIRDSLIDTSYLENIIRLASYRLKQAEEDLIRNPLTKGLTTKEKEAIRLTRAVTAGIIITQELPIQDRLAPDDLSVIRKQVSKEDGRKCALCGVKKTLQLHHIIPLFQRGSNAPANFVWLCEKCHQKQHSFWV